jgi:hypothetical protein
MEDQGITTTGDGSLVVDEQEVKKEYTGNLAADLATLNKVAQEVAKDEGAPVVEVSKSPQQLAAEAHAREEARRAAQTSFDPKVHGVGVHPAMGPQSVAELTQFVLELAARVTILEGK